MIEKNFEYWLSQYNENQQTIPAHILVINMIITCPSSTKNKARIIFQIIKKNIFFEGHQKIITALDGRFGSPYSRWSNELKEAKDNLINQQKTKDFFKAKKLHANLNKLQKELYKFHQLVANRDPDNENWRNNLINMMKRFNVI